MFSQVTTLPPSGFYYLGHLQHTVRALYLISVALMTHPVSQMPLCYKDSLKHPVLHDCMTYTNDWILPWCSHAFCTAIISVFGYRGKKLSCTDFLIHISHSLQHFSVMFRDVWLLQSNNVSPCWQRLFPQHWPSGQWKTFVYLFSDAHWALLCLQKMRLIHCVW